MPCLIEKNSPNFSKGDAEPPFLPGHPRLYSMRFCPYAQRALLYAAKKNIPAQIVNINLMNKPDWFLARNPKGTVPTFEHDKMVVCESLIVPEFLDGLYPETAILPSDPYQKAQQKILVERLVYIGPSGYGLFLLMKNKASSEEIANKVKEMDKVLDEAEGYAKDNAPFFTGSKPGYPDYMVYSFFERLWMYLTALVSEIHPDLAHLMDKFEHEKFPSPILYPKLTAWFAAMRELDEVKESQQPFRELVDTHKKMITGA